RNARHPRRGGRRGAAVRRARLGPAAEPARHGDSRNRSLLPRQAGRARAHRQPQLRVLMFTLRGVRKSYGGKEVVAGIDLDLRPAECYGLLGPNGAGKTTTLRLALGLVAPDAGDIRVLGEPVPMRAIEARRRLGVVPQADSLDPDFTVIENLLVYGRY